MPTSVLMAVGVIMMPRAILVALIPVTLMLQIPVSSTEEAPPIVVVMWKADWVPSSVLLVAPPYARTGVDCFTTGF